MTHLLKRCRPVSFMAAAALLFAGFGLPQIASAGTTGSITGTVTDGASGAPLANVKVTAASLSQTQTTVTDARGFYSLISLSADTYTVSFEKSGFQPRSVAGISVNQDQTSSLNEQLLVELKTIATVRASGASNLVKSNQGSDVYNVTGQQLTAATNPADLHETLYQYLAITPGVTGTGFPAQPRVRGGQVTDLGYEFEGIPIQDRITGFFTTNLANIGIGNIEVYTGGLPASGATNGTGYFNSVLKTGTYPGFTDIAFQGTTPEFNNFLTLERGYSTPNHKFSYYVGFDGVNSANQYDYGENTFPNVLFGGFNGPGPVHTRDWVSNFIYRPSQNDQVQFVLSNSLGEFDYNYLLMKPSGQPPALAFEPCAGNTPSSTSYTGMGGGTAPNGQTCPSGLYFGSLPNGGGNIWHHYGGLGKIQWNHNLNDHSYFSLRVAENYNQYIFDQPLSEPNYPQLENPGDPYNWYNALGYTPPPGQASGCPTYPYAAGTPVQQPVYLDPKTGTVQIDSNDVCAYNDGPEDFYGDRNSHQYFGNFDYTNAISAKVTLKAGLSHELDQNVFDYFLTNGFNSDGSWPNNYLNSIYPTAIDTAYGEGDFHVGHFLLSPGVEFAQEHYGFPGGGQTVHIINPTFNGTYTFDPNDVVRFSYGNTSSFVGTGYVYRRGSGTYNPQKPGLSFDPQQNHSADLMFEHQFDAETSLRFGPWVNRTSNYYESYRPVVSLTPYKLGPSVLDNGGKHNAFGLEFGLNHVNNRPVGTSFWVSGTYDNYWTTSTSLAGSFVNSPIPQNLIDAGYFVRAGANPLISATFLADYHSNRFHFDPLVYYGTDYYYNIGATSTTLNNVKVAPYFSGNEQIAGADWQAKLTTYEEVGARRNFLLGITIDNLFNNTNDVNPCTSNGTGCYPFDGSQSGVFDTAGTSIYQNYSQGPRTFYLFAGVRL